MNVCLLVYPANVVAEEMWQDANRAEPSAECGSLLPLVGEAQPAAPEPVLVIDRRSDKTAAAAGCLKDEAAAGCRSPEKAEGNSGKSVGRSEYQVVRNTV